MGGHNRPSPSLRWVGMDGEQIFARDTRDWRERRDGQGFEVRSSKFSELRTLNFELRIAPVALGVTVARLSHRCSMPIPILWPGPINGWR